MMISIVAALLQVSAFAQSPAPSQAHAETTYAKCGSYFLQSSGDRLTVFRDFGPHPYAVRVTSLIIAGNELMADGLDIQTNEPKDWVYIGIKNGEPGKFEAVLKDHILVGKESLPELTTFDCNDLGNSVLTIAVTQATAAKASKK